MHSTQITELLEVLDKVNVSSKDNGRKFTDKTRLENIKQLLKPTRWQPIAEGALSVVYANGHLDESCGYALISAHIDSLYTVHFHDVFDETHLLGTFDNSICNVALIDLMLKERLPANALVAFTGDEECDSRGASEVVSILELQFGSVWKNLEAVIVLDITYEGFSKVPFTVENYFVETNHFTKSRLNFASKAGFKEWLEKLLIGSRTIFIPDEESDPDESWAYDEFDLNCFSLCLPTAPHPVKRSQDSMHSDNGILAITDSVFEYSNALASLSQKICKTIQ